MAGSSVAQARGGSHEIQKVTLTTRGLAGAAVAISEFILMELYGLLRNPVVLRRPQTAARAAAVCEAFRAHPRWQVIGLSPDSRAFHDAFWPRLRKESSARRRAYDWRTALSLIQQGVTDFATANSKDFAGFGFARVWNPLEER